MTLCDGLLLVPLAFVAVESLYLLLVTAAAWLPRKASAAPAGALPRIAVIIPAHNEKASIAATVEQVLAGRYPPERRTVYVLADNCTDDTAALARAAGASVFERHDPEHRGKGQALDWCLSNEREALSAFDLLVLMDADTQMDPGFLEAIAAEMSLPGVDVVQGQHAIANPGANWRAALTYAGYCCINHTRPLGRTRLGGTAGLNGNGMAFRSALLLARGWRAQSIVEDVEYSILLVLDGVRARFCPEAIVRTAAVAGRAEAAPQRRRWELGRMQLAAQYAPTLLRRFVASPRWRFLDAALDLLVPPLALFGLLQALLLIGAVAFKSALWPVAAASMVALALHVAGGLAATKAPARVWLALCAVPLFLLWKIPIYALMVIKPHQKAWQRTARPGDQDPH